MFNFLTPNVPQIDAEGVKKAIDTKEDIVLVDVRTPQEFAKGHIAGSINMPVAEVENKAEKVLPDKSKTMYVYCLSGSRSIQAVSTMIKIGYTRAYSMKSGILAWRVKKYPLV